MQHAFPNKKTLAEQEISKIFNSSICRAFPCILQKHFGDFKQFALDLPREMVYPLIVLVFFIGIQLQLL